MYNDKDLITRFIMEEDSKTTALTIVTVLLNKPHLFLYCTFCTFVLLIFLYCIDLGLFWVRNNPRFRINPKDKYVFFT